MNQNELIRSSAAEYLTYIAASGEEGIEIRYRDENIWLTQKMLASVYDVNVATVNEHIKNIYKDNELQKDSTIRNFLIVQKEGNRSVSRDVAHYNLQMIIAVGFKVNNEKAVQFRKWANQIVKDYTIKGWDHEVLKDNGKISAEMARIHAETEFEKYRIVQDAIYQSDFDKMIEKSKKYVKDN